MANVVFVPGFMTDNTMWDDVVRHMSPSNKYYFPDLRHRNSIEAMARHVLENVPANFSLVGFSMGGYIAREAARLIPSRVNKLALVATSARRDRASLIRNRMDAVRHMSNVGFKGLSRQSVQMSLHKNNAQNYQLIQRIRDMNQRVGFDAFACQASTHRDGDLNKLSAIKQPCLVIAADGDRLRSVDESRELVEGISNSRMVIVPQSGHMIPLEKPLLLAAILTDWLENEKIVR